MIGIATLSQTASLIAEPTRTTMLVALMDGRALTAGELAGAGGITPATASGHLARLVDGGLLVVWAQGRYRYYRLATPAVARMIEEMMGVAGVLEAGRERRPVRTGPANRAMRRARRCYDHLAGELAVQMAGSLVERGYLVWTAEAASITPAGTGFLDRLRLSSVGDPIASSSDRQARVLCRPCMDWGERRLHVAGALGRMLFALFTDHGWVRQNQGSRAITITPAGDLALERHFGIRQEVKAARGQGADRESDPRLGVVALQAEGSVSAVRR